MVELINELEAILFAASKWVSESELNELLDNKHSDKDIKAALIKLKDRYNSSNNAINLVNEDESWKLTLKNEFLHFADKLMPSTELSKTIIETLAIIAWKNPILQSDLVKLRSPSVYDHIIELEKLKLITRVKKGRSYLIKVTDRFFDYFDLPESAVEEVFSRYEEVEAAKKEELEKELEFNKGDSFEVDEEERKKQLIKEIRENTIDPEAIIKSDKEFLDNFDKKLDAIEKESNLADNTLKEVSVSMSENSEDNLDNDLDENSTITSNINDIEDFDKLSPQDLDNDIDLDVDDTLVENNNNNNNNNNN